MNNQIQRERARIAMTRVLDALSIEHDDIEVYIGPIVTMFEFTPSQNTRISRIRNLKDDIAVSYGVPKVKIIAPLENGKIGIEVPNRNREIVPMLDMLYLDEYQESKMELPLAIGKTTDGKTFITDLADMPHLLVAGATGMGKSVGLNVILMSLLNRKKPDELKLVLIDPKQVELSVYNNIEKPYLAKLSYMEDAVITDVDDAKETLEAVIRLMEKRYSLLKDNNVRNIKEYNYLIDKGRVIGEKLPYYVVVIDEYGDLILQSKGREMETTICRIAQKARAVGIHMIISTQRPDTKIVTGSIKANFPTRIAFRTTTGTDSRVVLDRIGAEKLTGNGDMLYFAGGDFTRVQCAYVSTEEVMDMCFDIKEEYEDCKQTYLPQPPQMEQTSRVPEYVKKYARQLAGRTFIHWQFYDDWIIKPLQELGIVGELTETTTGFSKTQGYEVLISDIDEIEKVLS